MDDTGNDTPVDPWSKALSGAQDHHDPLDVFDDPLMSPPSETTLTPVFAADHDEHSFLSSPPAAVDMSWMENTAPKPKPRAQRPRPQFQANSQPDPSVPDAPGAPDAMREASERLGAANQMWPAVNQVLGMIQTDVDLQHIASRMELTRDRVQDGKQRNALIEALTPRLREVPALARMHRDQLSVVLDLTYDELLGISVVGPFWRDESVTEILIDGWDRIVIERAGRLELTPVKFRNLEHARSVARNLALVTSDRALSAAEPAVTADVAGARVAFTIDKIVKSGLALAIRKFPKLMDSDGLLAAGAWDEELRSFLADCVKARANILVSGGTGAGKTTLINALSSFIPDTDRIITIEDAFELQLHAMHWVQLQTKERASSDDEVHVSLAQLLRHTLRMRPDRIVVGEIRDADGAVVMLQAANTGHDGTMTTIHANSAFQALNFRLSYLARTGASMDQEVAAAEVSSAIDVVIQVSRSHLSGRRLITEVGVVDVNMLHGGKINPLQMFKGEDTETGPRFTRVGAVPAETTLWLKLAGSGLLDRWER